MAIGIIEGAIAIGITILLIGMFGRKAFKEFLKMVFGAKKDFEEVKKEFEPKTSKQK